jgi:putative transposase
MQRALRHDGARFFVQRARALPRPERQALIDRESKVSVTNQCQLLGLSRSSVYYRPRGVDEGDLLLMRRIDELHLEHPFLGARKLARLLKDEGYAVGRRHVGTLLGRMGIEALYRKQRTSLPDRAYRVYPYLLGGVVIERPNQVWPATSPTCPWRTALSTWWPSWTCIAAR